MKNKYSLLALVFICVVLLSYRYYYIQIKNPGEFKITTWDAFGYYLYLPSTIIYKDYTQLQWIDSVDYKYKLSGGKLYQADRHKKTNKFVFKYLGGVSIIQLPWFLIAHVVAGQSGYPQDGFSAPYQIILGFGMVLWGIFGLYVLALVLLKYFSDRITAATLFLVVMATNLIQYFSVDSAMSHVAIFSLYSLQLYFSARWHECPKKRYALAIGGLIGLATICRPTELVMMFIPLLWNTHIHDERRKKWKLVKDRLKHLFILIASTIIAALPQMIYWKITTDSWIYDVGSKWVFLNPFFRVIFGFTNGWVIYTPICILFLVGLFYVRRYNFGSSVFWFGIINIWIIISWFDWKYGASYSTRALVQSYPVYALCMASVIKIIFDTRWKVIFYIASLYLIVVNHFQLWQYNANILHYREMNWRYYKKIYLNSDPSPEQYSLLDSEEYVDERGKYKRIVKRLDSTIVVDKQSEYLLSTLSIDSIQRNSSWLKISAVINTKEGFHDSHLKAEWNGINKTKITKIRLAQPLLSSNIDNKYAFYIRIPDNNQKGEIKISLKSNSRITSRVLNLEISMIE